MKHAQFLVMALRPMSMEFEYVVPIGMFICRNHSKQTSLEVVVILDCDVKALWDRPYLVLEFGRNKNGCQNPRLAFHLGTCENVL
jgi:hypothetical protein